MPALAAVAFLTLFERNVIGMFQRRLGPNNVWIFGAGQALADALKLIVKELILPCVANRSLFWLAPFISLLWALAIWIVLPFGESMVLSDVDFALLFC